MFSSSMIMKTIKRNKVNTFRRHRDHDATTSTTTTTTSVTTDDEMSLTSTNDIDIDINNDDALMTTLPWKPSNSKKYITPTCYKLPKGNEIETMPSNSMSSIPYFCESDVKATG